MSKHRDLRRRVPAPSCNVLGSRHQSEDQARQVQDGLAQRLATVGLELHPDKTRIVYCQDADRDDHTVPAVSSMRSLRSAGRSAPGTSPGAATGSRGPCTHVQPIVQGWINYYGRFYKSMLYPLLRRVIEHLMRWAMRKYKRLRRREKRAGELLTQASRRSPRLFAHWRIGLRPAGWRGSPASREVHAGFRERRGVRVPPATRRSLASEHIDLRVRSHIGGQQGPSL